MNTRARFYVGQLVHHKLFDYRGVVFEVDSSFMLTDEWYDEVAKSRPPKDAPWYYVLVDDSSHSTYVAEQNLEADSLPEPINHPDIEWLFEGFSEGKYRLRKDQIQ